MRAFLTALIVTASPAGALAQSDGPPVAPPFPLGAPIITPGPPSDSDAFAAERTLLLSPKPEMRCADGALEPIYRDDLPPQAVGRAEDAQRRTVTLSFSVDADSRPRDIRPAAGVVQPIHAQDDDLIQASLAAWRFAQGARTDCRLTVRYEAVPLEQAEPELLMRYFAVTRASGPIRDAVAQRLSGPNGDCGEDWRRKRRPRTVAYPDFHAGRRPPPGGRSWTVVRWNLDAEGRATDVAVLGSSGDRDLDAEALRAIAETRAQAGAPLTGCVFNFHRVGPALPAPALPNRQDGEDPLQNCPPAVAARFQTGRSPDYPRAFQDRGVEGWALVRFDLATWGAIGNVEVIEAQPAAAFGRAARFVVQSGRATPGFEAGVRCVQPVRYRTSDRPDQAAERPAD